MAMKITEALLAEHVVFHNLFDHLEKVVPTLGTLAEVRALAGLLVAMLETHAKVEDELILEPLEHCIAQLGQQENFHQEHVEISQSLQAALAARNLRRARQLLLSAVVDSRTHFDKEERIIFPMAEKLLKNDSLATLAANWKTRREEAVR